MAKEKKTKQIKQSVKVSDINIKKFKAGVFLVVFTVIAVQGIRVDAGVMPILFKSMVAFFVVHLSSIVFSRVCSIYEEMNRG